MGMVASSWVYGARDKRRWAARVNGDSKKLLSPFREGCLDAADGLTLLRGPRPAPSAMTS